MSVIGEAALSAFFGALFHKFSSFDFKFLSEKRIHKEIEKWEETLKNINAVLVDAEERQMKDQQVKIWLADLQDLAYDIDDILDEFATDALEHKLMNNFDSLANSSKLQNCNPTWSSNLLPNTIMFNKKMMSKIKHVSKRLKQLETRKGNLQLIGFREPKKFFIPNRPPSTSLVNETEIYGRGNDKEAMVNLLLRDDGNDHGVSVIPIVGMGGIGKTTLAQLVYNDCSVRDYFDIQAWVCVSDEFDIIKITKTILQAITHKPCDQISDLNLLQVCLKDVLSKKKFLIVLDDIWNESYDDWTKLRSSFEAGAVGSKILITTRSSNVSSIVKTVSEFPLQKLSDEVSFSMFVHHALGARDFRDHLDLKEIGLQIVRKCDGLPLATKTIGGLLRGRIDHDSWKDILESEIWNLPEERSGIIPALWLSYFHLPSQLKQCFAYCSILPKDYEFTEQEIILLWMAEGFLNEANARQIENLGHKYFEELVSRSFFQVSKTKKSHYVMHDLINDLAQLVAGKLCFRMEGHKQMKFPRFVRHSSYIVHYSDGIKRFEIFYLTKGLRTFLPFTMMLEETCYLSNNVVVDLLPKLRCLRVLSLQRYHITNIPHSLGNLKQLRYLNFSFTEIRSLPDSLCALYNLETLLLRFCERIRRLPSSIGNLVNLYYLDITGAYLIKEMPNGVGKLTNLQALSNFIVGQGDGLLNIRELRNLSKLKGQLSLSELQNVDDAHCAREANLYSLSGLDDLELKWSAEFNENMRRKEVESEVLKLLQPHEELKALAIKYYAGIAFPMWIGDPCFKKLQTLKLEGCRNCQSLPAVGRLPLLKELYVKGMHSMTTVGNGFHGGNWQNAFPSLEAWHFDDMPEWKEWRHCEVDEKGKTFCCLRRLLIENCPKLAGTLPGHLPHLEKLVINKCLELVFPISNLSMLAELEIDGCKELVLGSFIDLWSVKKISLSNISRLTCLTNEMFMLESIKVEDLHVSACGELASLWQTKWGWMAPLRSLRRLKFEKCPKVASIGAAKEEKEKPLQLKMPSNIQHVRIQDCGGLWELSKSLHNLSFLTKLELVNCPKLVSISLNNLPTSLKTLVISNCENLQCLLDDKQNISFSTTSVLESLRVGECESLKLLSSSGKLPVKLKRLTIHGCPSLEYLAHDVGENTCLESIFLGYCKNVKYLPEEMDKLSNLQMIRIQRCANLVCFPETGLPNTAKLKSVWLIGCERLQVMPDFFSLTQLWIQDCPGVKSLAKGGFPTNLTTLFIYEPNISKAAMEWGLHRLAFLTDLAIDGSCIDGESFPQEDIGMNMKLPSSLISLSICNFKNLRKLSSNGFRSLTSLQSLSIYNCPKLKSLLKKNMLHSLSGLYITKCQLLKESCRRDKGKQWPKIVHIPRVEIDGSYIHE